MSIRIKALLPIVFFLLLGITISLGAQTIDAVSTVWAVDDDDRFIGQVLRSDFALQQLQVALDVEGQLVIVLLRTDSFSHGARGRVYFESDNCSGEPYLGANPTHASFGAPAAVAGRSGTLYLGAADSNHLRPIRSMLGETECEPLDVEIEVLYAEAVLDLSDQFAAPFRIVSDSIGDERATSRKRGWPQ